MEINARVLYPNLGLHHSDSLQIKVKNNLVCQYPRSGSVSTALTTSDSVIEKIKWTTAHLTGTLLSACTGPHLFPSGLE